MISNLERRMALHILGSLGWILSCTVLCMCYSHSILQKYETSNFYFFQVISSIQHIFF